MLRKIMSWVIITPAFIIACSEAESLNLEWIRMLAMVIIIGAAFWNKAFSPEQLPNRRKNNDNNNYQRYLARYGYTCAEKCRKS